VGEVVRVEGRRCKCYSAVKIYHISLADVGPLERLKTRAKKRENKKIVSFGIQKRVLRAINDYSHSLMLFKLLLSPNCFYEKKKITHRQYQF
jgi:hypothetical protein